MIDLDRINLTASCTDTSHIKRVKNAGETIRGHQIMFNGIKIHKGCYYDELITPIIKSLQGFHEPQEEAVFHEVLKHIKPNSTMIELGSFWAWYSMWFQKDTRFATNIMIEPDSKNLEAGIKNFELNNMEGKFIKASIPAFDVLHYLFNENISDVAILHIDIQGAELDFIKDIQHRLDMFEYIFIGTHDDKNIHYPLLELLRDKHKLNIITEFSMDESYQCDGLIVATRNMDFPKYKVSKFNYGNKKRRYNQR